MDERSDVQSGRGRASLCPLPSLKWIGPCGHLSRLLGAAFLHPITGGHKGPYLSPRQDAPTRGTFPGELAQDLSCKHRGSQASYLVRPRQAQDMLRYVCENEIGGEGGDLIEAGFAEFAFDIVVYSEAVASKGLHGNVGGFPGGIGGQEFGHVCFGTTGLSLIKEGGGTQAHEIGGFDVNVCLGKRELDALILADGASEDDALSGTVGCLFEKPASVADAFGCDKDTLSVHAVEDIAKALSFLAYQVAGRDADVIEGEFVGFVVEHGLNGGYT